MRQKTVNFLAFLHYHQNFLLNKASLKHIRRRFSLTPPAASVQRIQSFVGRHLWEDFRLKPNLRIQRITLGQFFQKRQNHRSENVDAAGDVR